MGPSVPSATAESRVFLDRSMANADYRVRAASEGQSAIRLLGNRVDLLGVDREPGRRETSSRIRPKVSGDRAAEGHWFLSSCSELLFRMKARSSQRPCDALPVCFRYCTGEVR